MLFDDINLIMEEYLSSEWTLVSLLLSNECICGWTESPLRLLLLTTILNEHKLLYSLINQVPLCSGIFRAT